MGEVEVEAGSSRWWVSLEDMRYPTSRFRVRMDWIYSRSCFGDGPWLRD